MEKEGFKKKVDFEFTSIFTFESLATWINETDLKDATDNVDIYGCLLVRTMNEISKFKIDVDSLTDEQKNKLYGVLVVNTKNNDVMQTPEQKELALEKLPAAWNYLKANILPPLRRVEVMIVYADGNIVEQRTLKPKPAPAPAPAPAPESYEVVDETITGVIVEMPESKREMREEHRVAAREAKQDATMTRREAREAARIAKRDAREAKKIERRSARAAEKMARKEAKAAKKGAKAMQKNEKDLEKM